MAKKYKAFTKSSMAYLFGCKEISKSFGSQHLFEGITFSVEEKECVGLIGPNGAGKSTLLRILAGLQEADDGEVLIRKGLTLSYVAQTEDFDPLLTVNQILASRISSIVSDEQERWMRIGLARSRVGLPEMDQKVGELSGGWKKRLAFAVAMIQNPDVLLMDEPTNHLDMSGILWLERFISSCEFTSLIVTHDRRFLENVAKRIVEINRIYPSGSFSVQGNYSRFLEKRAEYLSGIERYEANLANKVRRELEWLSRGPKARTTKAKARIDNAQRLQNELSGYEARSIKNSATIDLVGTGRKSKILMEAIKLTKGFSGKLLFDDVSFVLSPGVRLGVIGANGSGKSTLLRILSGAEQSEGGELRCAKQLKVVMFEQHRAELKLSQSLSRALAPEGESVIFQGRELHVAAWAKRFLFRPEQLQTPVGSLSGGEQARVAIARLMLQPADVLLLDEPTNDLDIETLQILEESLEEFSGAIVLVTHDRYMLERIATEILALDGDGQVNKYADYFQWEESKKAVSREGKSDSVVVPQKNKKAKQGLSYKEQLEFNQMEQSIAEAEKEFEECQNALSSSAGAANSSSLVEVCNRLQEVKNKIDRLYERWAELDGISKGNGK